ncbi:MAG TPA: hypothetical protein VMO88_00420 [Acidimicrobiales bacterium]|nr:hypothetical protein [Acidimicrobiales bacterium]
MLYAWGFERVGVVAGDLYFQDPSPVAGQEGAERGVRLEVRFLERPPLTGSVYAAQPIVIDRPIWRADLLETVDGKPGSHDRTHHHPRFRGWEPGKRQFEPELSADPIAWLTGRLQDLASLLTGAEIDPDEAGANDAVDLAKAAPEIAAAVESLLARVRNGELAKPPDFLGSGDDFTGARVSWL